MDSLLPETPLLTYPQLQNLLRIEFARARRYDYALSCLVLRVDRLDHLADLYGAEVRQEILRQVVGMVRAHARSSDSVSLSADRVTVVLPHTDAEGAQTMAARLHQKVDELTFRVDSRELPVTVSLGVATSSDRSHIFYDSLLKNAESALESVARGGGNGVEVFSGAPEHPLSHKDRHSA